MKPYFDPREAAPREEMGRRMAAQIMAAAGLGREDATRAADAVMGLFHEVDEIWRRIDITAMENDGQVYIDTRYLILSVPANSVRVEHLADRTVEFPAGAS